jgi:hypothetical protein
MPRSCPIIGCTRVPETGHLMCKPHWFAVPQPLRNAVWKTYDHGRGLLTPEYAKARNYAIASVNRERVGR